MVDMPPSDPLLQWLGVKTIDVAAGFGGGIVRGLINPAYTWPMRLTSAVVGAITAGYLTPPATHLASRWLAVWGVPSGDVTGSVGFFLGLCGMTVAEMLIRWARHWRDKAPPPTIPP